METSRKNQKKMLEIKNTREEKKTTLDGVISILDKAEERISDLEDRLTETPPN